MTYQEIKTRYHKIFDFIAKSRIKDALDALGVLCNHSRNRDFRQQLDSHYDTYLNMLKYAFEMKDDDPQKAKVYNRLIKDIFSLTDDVKEDIIRSSNLLQHYQLNAVSFAQSEAVIAELSQLADKIDLQNESQDFTGVERARYYNSPAYKENVSSLFMVIWHADKLKDVEISLLKKICTSEVIAWYDQCVLVSALTLSLIRHFDSAKIDVLFSFYEAGGIQIWQRALVGLVMSLVFYNNRIAYYPEITHRLKALQGMSNANKSIEIIIQQFIKARETEKITRKIQEEILPEMMRIKSRLEEKLDLEDMISSFNPEGKNPEWETFFKDSPDVYNKLEEFTNMQMEGADVFLGAFAMLKHFSFFNEIRNWFLPFYKENESIADSFSGSGEGVDLKQFGEGLEKSHFLCNSDKYSFCLNIRNMPGFQKSTVMELFNMELKAMNEMADDDEMINTSSRTKVIVTQYFHDLYRFYKLHHLKAEFDDIFKLPVPVYETELFKNWIDDAAVLRNIGEFFFEKNYYHDAIAIFKQIVETNHSYELFEKIGYCYQQTGDYDKALEYYHKAELLDKNKLWLINRIAWCYKKKGEYELAIGYYIAAEKLEPDNLQVHAYLGQINMETGEFEKALKYYFKVEYLQPDNYKVYRPISWCSFMLGKFDVAAKYLEKALSKAPSKHDYLNLGHIYWCRDDRKKAIENYKMSFITSGRDVNWFSGTFIEDSKYLEQHGIKSIDIPLMIDYIRLSAL